MYRLNFFKRSTSHHLRVHLVKTLIFPRLDYCSAVFCDLSNEQDLRLKRLLNRGVRYIFGLRRDERMSPYRERLNWLTPQSRRKYMCCCLLYKILAGDGPPYLANHFSSHHTERPQRIVTRRLNIPQFRTETYRQSFQVSTAYLWNELPVDICNSPTLGSFKRRLFQHLFRLESTSL